MAETLATSAWLVGGVVRDALLDRPTRDIDVVVAGDAPSAARRLASGLDGELTMHPAFGTAAVQLRDGLLDVVTARAESYRQPGSLPDVWPADLEADLARRDFAVNAMAVELSRDGLGALVDPQGGAGDVAAHRLRILHPASFRDDATRVLRGVRYEARLGFRMDEETEHLARAAVTGGLLSSVGPDRLRRELLLLLEERSAGAALQRFDDLGGLDRVVPAARLDDDARAALHRVEALVAGHLPDARRALLRLGLLVVPLPSAARAQAIAALHLSRPEERVAAAAAAARDLGSSLAAIGGPDATADVLGRLPPEAALAVAAWCGGRAADRALDWLDRLRHVRLDLDGHDLQRELSLSPSPALGALLDELRRRKLRGELPDRASELSAARLLAGPERLPGEPASGPA